jgi:phage gp45-like
MSEFGIVTGSEVIKNLDGDKKSRVLQVQITSEEDVQSVELYRMPGEDYNPSNGTRVLVIEIGTSKAAVAASDVEALDDLAEGEREYYSDDGEKRLATIRLNGQSEIVLNAGEDYAVRYSKLEEQHQPRLLHKLTCQELRSRKSAYHDHHQTRQIHRRP